MVYLPRAFFRNTVDQIDETHRNHSYPSIRLSMGWCAAYGGESHSVPHFCGQPSQYASIAIVKKFNALMAIDWINRSSHLPLSIGLYAKSDLEDWESTFKFFTSLFDINSQYKRWSVLDLFNLPDGAFKLLHGGDTSHALDLDRLNIYRPHTSSQLLFRTGGVLLRPRELSIQNVMVKILNIDWSRLTTISITSGYLNHIRALVLHAHNLRKMTLVDPTSSRISALYTVELPSIIRHSTLRDLSIVHTAARIFSVQVDVEPLEFPNLESLDLCLEYASFFDATVLPFISMAPQITQLVLHIRFVSAFTWLTIISLARVLQALPNVEHFEVKAPDPMELLEHLCPLQDSFENEKNSVKREEYSLLPKLSSIVVRSREPLTWSIVPKLLNRHLGISDSLAQIRSIKISVKKGYENNKIDGDYVRQIEELCEGGVTVEIKNLLGVNLLGPSFVEGLS